LICQKLPIIIMLETVQCGGLKMAVRNINSQVLEIKKQTKLERKDPLAWKKLEKLGRKISKEWKSSKTSWQLISEGRR